MITHFDKVVLMTAAVVGIAGLLDVMYLLSRITRLLTVIARNGAAAD